MHAKKKKERFINKLEFFYRNFGSKWNIKDFINDRNKNDEMILKDCLLDLESKNIVKITTINYDFEIIDLPSKFFSRQE